MPPSAYRPAVFGTAFAVWLRAVCLLLPLLLSAPAWAASRQVLVLYSLGADSASAWQSLIHRGLYDELARNNLSAALGIYEERFDAVRVGEKQAVAGMEAYLRAKYATIKFDTIITENYLAGRFMSERPTLFAGVPRVYLNHARHDWQPADGIGYEVSADFRHGIGLIPMVAPQVKRVVVVGDRTERTQELMREVRQVAAGYGSRLQFEFWDQQSFGELYQRAGKLGPGSAIFLLSFYHDSLGASSRPVEVARNLAAVAQVPIFTHLESLVVPGAVGGYVTSAERIGRAIGSILQQREPDIGGIPGYIFDYPTAQRFGLVNLPRDVQWLNRPQTVWEQYRWQIVTSLTLITLEAALITALVVALRSRRRTLVVLGDERKQLEARVLQRTMELLVANTKLEQLVTTDPLTGIGNRRRMTEQINKELERCRRFKHPLALLMVDIDHFKDVNDSYGHDAGDQAIIAVSHALCAGMRSIDMAARFGGEEFVLLMPETDIEVAGTAAERLRGEIAAMRIDIGEGKQITLTISIGVAASDPDGPPDTASSLLVRADKVLYQAKNEGRDRVVCA